METFDDMRDQYNSWSREKQEKFFQHYTKMQEEYRILEEENTMLKEALTNSGDVK